MRIVISIIMLSACLLSACRNIPDDKRPFVAAQLAEFRKPIIHREDVPLTDVPEFAMTTFRSSPYFNGKIVSVQKQWGEDNDWTLYIAKIEQPDGRTMTLGYEWFVKKSKVGRLIEGTWTQTSSETTK